MTNAYDLSSGAAAAYQAKKVPAIFRPLAEASLDRIDLTGVSEVLDVACGSGVVVRCLARRLTEPVHIIGADLSEAMIGVAREVPVPGTHKVDWHVAPAEAMGFPDAAFDLVFCQQGLQFFPDKPAALAAMRRVLRPGGRLVLTCWAGTPPIFAAIAEALTRRVSAEAAHVATTPFAFSDAVLIGGLIGAAGFAAGAAERLDITRRIPATEDAIATELLASPNEAVLRALPKAEFAALVAELLDTLQDYRTAEDLALPQSSWLFVGTVPPTP